MSKRDCKDKKDRKDRKDRKKKCCDDKKECGKTCNDERCKYECNEPYRIEGCDCCDKLNVKPPVCLKKDPTYKQLYHTLYQAIRDNDLEIKLQNMIVSNTSGAYDTWAAELVLDFGLTYGNASPRLLVAESDGTVVFDSSKSMATNTYTNWKAKAINENHNSRVAVFACQLFACGVGYETKYSTSVSQNQAYVAIRAGPYLNDAGTYRLSQNS